jgi:HEAT repeat protein
MAVALALLGAWLGGTFAWPGTPDERAAALAAGEVSARTAAALAIAREEPARAATLLVPALGDRDPGVRLLAARLLLRRGSPEALATATSWLTTSGGRDRALGLLALRDARELPPEARHAAERALVDGDVPVRVRALELLAGHPLPGQTGPFLRALDDDDQGVRLRAVRTLAAAREPRAGLALLARLVDGDRQVRAEAVVAVAAVGDVRAVPALLRLLGDAAGDLRGEAAAALGHLRAEAAVPALSRLAARWPRDDLARRALAALGDIATPAAIEGLIAAAREPTGGADVRLGFALAGTRGLPALVHELAAGPATSAALAATALGELGDFAATKPLVGALARRDAAAGAAAAALARLGDPAAVPALAAAAIDAAAPTLRAPALAALATFEDDRAARPSSDPVTAAPPRTPTPTPTPIPIPIPTLTLTLTLTLTRLQESTALVAFASGESAPRAALAPTLARFSAGVAALEATVADRAEAPSVRAAAAWALGAVAQERHAHEILAAAARDPRPAVAANARAALWAGGHSPASAREADARLVAADETPLPGRWARFAVGNVAVWVMSDLDGRVQVAGLPAGDVTLTVPSE